MLLRNPVGNDTHELAFFDNALIQRCNIKV